MKKIIIGLLATSLLMTGCTSEKTKDEDEQVAKQADEEMPEPAKVGTEVETPQTQEEQQKEAEEFLEQLETTTNEKLEEQINTEKNIIEHKLFIMEKLGIAGGDIVVSSIVKDNEASAIADKYAKQLKNEYPDLGIAIRVMRDGQEVTTVELD